MAQEMGPNWGNIFNQIGQGAERNIGKPTDFHGKRTEDAEEWLVRFIRYLKDMVFSKHPPKCIP
jgi:hypothetical protein